MPVVPTVATVRERFKRWQSRNELQWSTALNAWRRPGLPVQSLASARRQPLPLPRLLLVFFDLVMAGLGVCSIDDIAISVLTTVLGHQPEKGWIITDAGWMALSRDRGTARQKVDQGYGQVCDIEGNPIENLTVLDTNQEHGIIGDRSGRRPDLSKFPVGTTLRILPNHACATAAQHSCYHIVRKGTDIEAIWERFNGW
jgi:D-serine deaminase-like pyridoxal phosphate-dependent protein